jgi:ribosomal protein S12 methylthiotransferase accessory factor
VPPGKAESAVKRWSGTSQRSVAPHETLARYERFASVLGITRLADLTGLDYLGIPVFAAMRPNARSLSVHQGKGLDAASARTSAFMEAAEFDHAERISPRVMTFAPNAPPHGVAIADLSNLPRLARARLRRNHPLDWVRGRDMMCGTAVLVPRALVSIDFTQPPDACFIQSTDGLASGNSLAEAISCGLHEVIERDATALWRLRAPRDKADRRLVLSTVTSRKPRGLLARLEGAAIAVSVWETTTDIGVASFLCQIREAAHNTRSEFGAFWGAGCHLNREVALCRAITEAVQTRLTYISGARDDLMRHNYGDAPRDALLGPLLDLWEKREGGRRYDEVPDGASESSKDDVVLLLGALRRVGLAQAIAVDLTRRAIGIPVVRVIVPGLESDHPRQGYRLGPRARAILQGPQ